MFLIVSTQSHIQHTYINTHTRAFTLSRKKHTHTIYEEEVKKTYNAYYINIRKTRKQETSASPLNQAKRNAGDFLGRQSLVLQKASSHTIMPGEICMLENE